MYSGSWNQKASEKPLFPPIPQIWKNETVAEQNKLSPTEKPILLSKDIELKLAALDREVQYLLNKAKFAKPKPKKEKNTTKSDSGKNATAASESENTIPPTEGKQEGKERAGVIYMVHKYHVFNSWCIVTTCNTLVSPCFE